MWVFSALGLALLVFCCLADLFPFEFIVLLVAGWGMFLFRVVPQIQLDVSAIALSCSALLLFAIGLHGFLRWLSSAAWPQLGTWRPRWTVSIVALTLLMFVAGISFVGVTHQVTWMATSKEPLFRSGAGTRMQSGNNLKQLALGAQNYDDTFALLPPGASTSAEGRILHGWMTFLLPFCEQRPLFDTIALDRPWDDPAQGDAFRKRIKYMESPYGALQEQKDELGRPLTHYAGNVHVLGGTGTRTIASLSDGAANTIIAGEAAGDYVPWGKPGNWRDPALDINRSRAGFGAPRPTGAMFAFVDGHVRLISPDVAPEVLRALSTPDGGEKIPDDY
jgi:prepilin-type processing-associated H-X9-DG protein